MKCVATVLLFVCTTRGICLPGGTAEAMLTGVTDANVAGNANHE